MFVVRLTPPRLEDLVGIIRNTGPAFRGISRCLFIRVASMYISAVASALVREYSVLDSLMHAEDVATHQAAATKTEKGRCRNTNQNK